MLRLCRQTDGWMYRRTIVKQYAPDLLIWGHKNIGREGIAVIENYNVPYLTLSKMTNFRFFQTERVCRRQFQI